MPKDLLKLAQQIKDAEGITLASVIQKVEGVRGDIKSNADDIKKTANALLKLKKEVDSIPLTSEVKKLKEAITAAEKRIKDVQAKEYKTLDDKISKTEKKLRQEIDDKIPDVVTVTEKITEVAKELDEEETGKILEKVKSEETVKSFRDTLESFEGDERLDASAIKNLPKFDQGGVAGGGSNLSVFKDGAFVSSSTRLNFTGSGVTVSNEGGRTKVDISGGGSGSTISVDSVEVTDPDFLSTGDVDFVATGSNVTANLNNNTVGLDELSATGTPSSSTFLRGDNTWATPAGSGDVSGPASSTDNAIARFDSTTGTVIQNSVVTIADTTGNMAGVGTLNTHTIPAGTGTIALTSDLHDAVTVTDSSEIDFTLTGQDITASLIAGSIDETKLDASTNASLDLADSALQNIVEDTTPQLGGELDAQSNNIIDLADVTFKTGAVGGTLRTGTANADKFVLQAYDVDGAAYQTVLQANAGNTPTMDILSTATIGGTQIASTADLHSAVTLAGSLDYLTISGQEITRNAIDLTTDVTGDLPFANIAQIATDSFVGRDTAGTGDLEVLSAAAARGILNVEDGANNYTHPNHSGDVTSVGDGATTIANDVVTNAKLANVATATIKGRVTADTGDPEDLTATQVRTLINVEDGATADQTDAEIETAINNQLTGTVVGTTDTQTLTNKTLQDAKVETSINAQTGTSYTLVLSDASKLITMDNVSANTITVPPNSSVAFPTGTKLLVIQLGAGSTTVAAGAGVTINNPTSVALEIGEQHGSRALIKQATDTWQMI